MKNLQKFGSNIGFNEPKKWSKDLFEKTQTYIKSQYEQLTPTQKLEIRLYAIKAEMEHYLLDENTTEIRKVGDFIKEGISAFKELVGVSQKRLAEHWGISQNMGKYLSGERVIGVELALKIAATFAVPPKLLLHIQNKNELLEVDKLENYQKKYSFDNIIQSPSFLGMKNK
jgi:plasmid maintenance system antidote protein VapI